MAVEKLKIVWNNLWRKGTILGQSSQDPQHPSSDTQEDTKDMYWKSASLGSPDYISLDVGEFEPAGKGTMAFDEGLVEPKVGEWLYGAGAQGKVVSVTKATGTWGVDATGSIVLEKCEGRFNDNEVIDGSIGGSTMLKVNEPDTGAGVDLVRNGEFEGGTGGWTAGTGATLASVAGGKIGNCLQVTCDATPNRYGYQNITGLTIGKIYKVKIHFKKGTASGGFIKIGTSENGTQYGSQTGLTDANFKAYEFIFVATVTNVYITLGSEEASKTALFDEVSLYELDEANTEKEIDFFSLLDHNISPTATIELKGAMDVAFTKGLKTITIPYHETNIRAFLPYWGEDVLVDGGLNIWTTATDLTNWTESISGTSTVNREDTEKIEGAYSCRFDVDASDSSVYIQEARTLIPGRKYKIIVWYKNSLAGKTSRIQFFDSGENVFLKDDGTWAGVSSSVPLPNSTVWKKFEIEFYAHANYSDYFIRLRSLASVSSSIYFDDVSIKPYPVNNRIAYPILRRYWKIEITDADNTDEYIKAAIPFMGKYFQPNRNPSKEQKRGDRVFSEVELTETLSAYGKEKGTLEQAYLPFKGLTEADKDEIRKMMRECKIDHAFMIIYKPSDPNQDSVLYRFSDQPADLQYNHYDSYSWEMNLVEVK